MKIKKGDTVKILLGKDRGKSGKVERVLNKSKKIIVAGANVYKRSLRADALKRQGMDNAKGQIIDITKPLDISNVMLICPNCKKPTRIGFKVTKGAKSRICKKCGKEIIGEQVKA